MAANPAPGEECAKCGSMKFLGGDQLDWAANTDAEKSPKQGARRSLGCRGQRGAADERTGRRNETRGARLGNSMHAYSCGEMRLLLLVQSPLREGLLLPEIRESQYGARLQSREYSRLL